MANGFYSRNELEKFGFKSLGQNVLISEKASIYGAENMCIGDNVRVDDFCLLLGSITLKGYNHIGAYSGLHASMGSITLDLYSCLSSQVTIYAASDDYSGKYMTNPMVPKKYRNDIFGNVYLGKHAIVGVGSSLLTSAKLNEGAAVGAMSLVNRELDPWTINAGVPTRVIRKREKGALEYEELLISEQ